MTVTELLAPVAAPASLGAEAESLHRLATLRAERPVVLSLYVRLTVQDRIRNRYRVAVRNAIRQVTEVLDQPGIPHEEQEALNRDLERMAALVEDPHALPHSPGMVIFASEALDLFETLPLPRVVQTRLLIGTRPNVAEALAGVEHFGRMLVAVVDRNHARFFEVGAFEVTELECLVRQPYRGGRYHEAGGDAPGWGEHDFHNRIREERHRHAANVARQLEDHFAARAWQGIVLAGPARAIAEEQHFLPRQLAARVVGTARLNPALATTADVRRVALEARTRWETAREAAIVNELNQAIGTGWAVAGPHATLRALARGQVRLLLVAAGQAGSGFRCAETGRLVIARGACQGEGEPIPVPDLVSEVLEEAWRQHLEVEVIEDPESRAAVDGLAALLRFR